MMEHNPDEHYEYRTIPPIASFILKLGGTMMFLIGVLALIAGWSSFLNEASTIIRVVIGLLLALASGTLLYLAAASLMNLRYKHRAELREAERHDVQLHLLQTRIHANDQGNKPSLLMPNGNVINLPVGNFVQAVSQTYSPHITYPKADTRIQEVPTEQLALPEPVVQVPTGRELLLNGSVEQALVEGHIILGVGEDGKLKRLKIKRCFSTLISGLPSVGKTTTVFWIAGQLTLIGAKLWIVDPHMNFENEEGEKSLASELAELADSFQFPPSDGRPKDVIARVRWMYQQLRTRQQPGYIVRAENTVIGIMDEFNSVAGSISKDIIVVEEEDEDGNIIRLNFAETVALVEREGRKYGIHFMLIGHKWTQKDIGGDNSVRTNATTYLVHKMNDKGQAELLLSGGSKQILALTVGSYWITGPTWNADPARITTPAISAVDLPVLRQIRDRRGPIHVANPANVVEGAVATPVAVPVSRPYPQEPGGYSNGYSPNPPGKQADTENSVTLSQAQFEKMIQVLEMDELQKGQNEIIKAVWQCEPNTRAGQAAAEELRLIRAYLSGQHRKTMKLGM